MPAGDDSGQMTYKSIAGDLPRSDRGGAPPKRPASRMNLLSTLSARTARLLPGLIVAANLVAAHTASAATAASPITLKATYSIGFGVATIGKANVEARFTDRGYAAAITGATYGIVRLVSDSSASLNGNGRLATNAVYPNRYSLDTNEDGFRTQVRMGLRNGAVTDLSAAPQPVQASDRVPLTAGHKQNVVDPVGAFIVSLDPGSPPDGVKACNRTVRVFDGWQRYDVRLTYKETRPATGPYNGDIFVCTARYVPVAGYRTSLESVQYMAANKRLEISLAPIKGTGVWVPYRILIGTKFGDLTINATNFEVSGPEQHAQVN